jgi:diaminopimelate epimerase
VNSGQPFFKLEALGNDFVLLDHRQGQADPAPDRIRALANRHTGIGFDQLLIVKPSSDDVADISISIFNQDASPARQCGNGMRAIARWLEHEQPGRQNFVLSTPAGLVSTNNMGAEGIRVEMGTPRFGESAVGLREYADIKQVIGDIPGLSEFGLVSMGNPHLILRLDRNPDIETVSNHGRRIGQDPAFNEGINISFVYTGSESRVNLHVHERGVGPTLACGSAACATGAFLIRAGQSQSPVNVDQPGGRLVIDWRSESEPLWMTGPAQRVFNGTFL